MNEVGNMYSGCTAALLLHVFCNFKELVLPFKNCVTNMDNTHAKNAEVPDKRTIAWEHLGACCSRRSRANLIDFSPDTCQEMGQQTLQSFLRVDLDKAVTDECNCVFGLVNNMVRDEVRNLVERNVVELRREGSKQWRKSSR